MEPISWITIVPPFAPLQEEAYLPQSGTVSLDDKKSLSLHTASVEAYETVKGFFDEQQVLVSFRGPNRKLILNIRSSNCHVSVYQVPCSVPPSHLRPRIDYFSTIHENYGGKKHLENLADNMCAEHFPSTLPCT